MFLIISEIYLFLYRTHVNILCAVRSCVFKCRFELNFRLIALIITGENKCRTNEVEESAGEVQELNKRGTCTAVIKYMEQMKEVLKICFFSTKTPRVPTPYIH